jgi:hypothetical protein
VQLKGPRKTGAEDNFLEVVEWIMMNAKSVQYSLDSLIESVVAKDI